MRFLPFFGRVLLFMVALTSTSMAHDRVIRARTPVVIPDLPGYLTLKCDFHIHTVFSDGLVWPTVRSEEAWREGLDVIAITDHIEYQPHKNDMFVNHNRAYDLARPAGESLDLIVIRGSEVTRSMPPGHLNAIFLKDSAALDTDAWPDVLAEAHRQGAFIFWNHPGWAAQLAKDGEVRWYPEHTELLEKGILQGIEVANGRSYYPEAFAWALEKKLTLLSNSDIHQPLNLDYEVHDGDHRPLTLVFAKERSAEAVREALFAQRTAVYAGERLLGEAQYLDPLFQECVTLNRTEITLRGDGAVLLQIHNHSDIPFTLERAAAVEELSIPRRLTLPPHRTVLASVQATAEDRRGTQALSLPYRVNNLLTAPDRPLEVQFKLQVTFVPAS